MLLRGTLSYSLRVIISINLLLHMRSHAGAWEREKNVPPLGFELYCFASLATPFFVNSDKEGSKKTPPQHTSFYFQKAKIKVPSSLPIFVAAAELTNH